jgi:hypothetical protein
MATLIREKPTASTHEASHPDLNTAPSLAETVPTPFSLGEHERALHEDAPPPLEATSLSAGIQRTQVSEVSRVSIVVNG